MTENKRIFLTGAVVAGLLLLIPPYLNFIGISVGPEIGLQKSDNSLIQENPPLVEQTQQTFDAKTSGDKNSFIKEDVSGLVSFKVNTDKLNLLVSNESGGSLKEVVLVSSTTDGHKYLGGYDSNDLYQDSINVSLILNKTKCSPCLSVAGGEKELFFDVPFNIVFPEILNNETFVLSGNDSLVINMSATINDFIINKTTTYYGDSYLIKHKYDVRQGGLSVSDQNNFNFSWYGGVRNTEKDREFETSQYTQAYLAQNKKIEDFYITPEAGGSYSSVDFKGKTDWVAIRNKYFINAFVSSFSDGGFLGGGSISTKSDFIMPEYSMGLNFSERNHFEITQFFGPLDVDYIASANTYLDYVMNFGWLPIQPFSRSVLWLLKLLHGFLMILLLMR